MRIAVAGGTGTVGRPIVDRLTERGHEVRVLSRHSAQHPVDLTTGEGLAEALAGCDVVVDASNCLSAKHAAATLVEGSRRLLAAEDAAGVGHHVCISIVGCDLVPTGYYKVKVEQERTVMAGPVPWSIVRATQFHELVAWILGSAARWRVLPVPRMRLQSIAAAEVAGAVADVAEAPPLRGRIDVAGPRVAEARELARGWRSATGRRAVLLPVPLPGRIGRALRAGALTDEAPEVRGTVPFEDWLASTWSSGN
jgi:uncharacterized protein YbjT (DUF2867 family)